MAEKHCCIEQCLSSSKREEDIGVTFHKLPKEVTRHQSWLEATQLLGKEMEQPIFVCSRHFRKTDFQAYKESKFILKSDAVPSIFPWNKDAVNTDLIMESGTNSILAELLGRPCVSNPNTEDIQDVSQSKHSRKTIAENEEKNENNEKISILEPSNTDILLETSVEVQCVVDTAKNPKNKKLDIEAESPSILGVSTKVASGRSVDFNNEMEVKSLNDNEENEGENLQAIKKFIEEQEKKILELEAEVKSAPRFCNENLHSISKDELTELPCKTIDTEIASVDSLRKIEEAASASHEDNVAVAASVINIILSESEAKLMAKTSPENVGKASKSPKAGNSSMSLSVGSKLEAKDFSESWHPAHIVEVDHDEMEVLVHYDRGPKRHNEWISVSSPRLRPFGTMSEDPPLFPTSQELFSEVAEESQTPQATSPPFIRPAYSEPVVVKEEPKVKPKLEFHVGERCLARWRNNMKFMATVFADLGNDTYEITFDDGYHWTCPVSRLNKMKEGMDSDSLPLYPVPAPLATLPQAAVGATTSNVAASVPLTAAGPPYHTHLFDPTRDYLGSKSERRERKRKLNVKELFNIGQKKKKENDCPPPPKRERPRIIRKKPTPSPRPTPLAPATVAKQEIKAEIKTEDIPEVKIEVPDAVASIIGIKAELEPVQSGPSSQPQHLPPKQIVAKSQPPLQSPAQPLLQPPPQPQLQPPAQPQSHPQSVLQARLQSPPQPRPKPEPQPRVVMKDLKIEIVKIDPFMNCDDKDDKEDPPTVVGMEVDESKVLEDRKPYVKDEPKSDDRQSIEIPLENTLVPTDSSVNKLEKVEAESPKPELMDISSYTATFELSAEKSPEKDKKKDLSRVKKARKLRLMREKKALREVERVKNELEEMKKQMEEMKKQVCMKKEDMFSNAAADPQVSGLSLLPGEWACRWLNGQPVGKVSEMLSDPKDASKGALPRRSVQVEDHRLPEGWAKHLVRRSLGSSAGKWDIVLISPDFRRFHTKHDMKIYLESVQDESLKPYEHALLDFSVHRKLSKRLGWDNTSKNPKEPPVEQLPPGAVCVTSPLVSARVIKKSEKDKVRPEKKPKKSSKKTVKKKRDPQMSSSDYYPEAGPPPQDLPFDNSTLQEGYVYVGPFKVQVFENLLRCPAEGCFKNFRNHTLLCMHIKHYHRELKKIMGNTPKVLDLAWARAKVPVLPEIEQKAPKSRLPKAPKLEMNAEDDFECEQPYDMISTTPVKSEMHRLSESPKFKNTMIQKPKRPKVLLPVRKLDNPPSDDRNDFNPFEDSDSDEDFVPKKEPTSQLDFEAALTTHTVTKPASGKKKSDKKKFAIMPNRPVSEDEEYCTGNSDFDTMSSFPRSGSPDKLIDTPTQPMSSESNEGHKDENMFMMTESGEKIKIVHMKSEEIINCHCGLREEDGLMIQCELCLCWQHALCHNIHRISDVPEKYTCSICLNPRRGRRSRRFLHDQDRLYEGLLPGAKPCEALRRSHELSGNLIRIQSALHALRVKYYVAIKKDHPKLYLWAKDWECNDLNFSQDKLCKDYMDLNIMISDINKENLPMKPEDISLSDIRTPPSEEVEIERGFTQRTGQLGSQALLSGLLSSPGGVSLDLPISTSELERLAKSVQESELQRAPPVVAPQPEAAIENSVCRERLLKHIQRCQALLDARLDSIEAQVAELESQDPSLEDDETAEFFPRTKQTIQMLMRDLDTMEELAVIT